MTKRKDHIVFKPTFGIQPFETPPLKSLRGQYPKVMDNLTCCHFVFSCLCGHLPGDLVSAPCVFRSDRSPCPLPCLSCLNPRTAIPHPPSEEVICS